MLFCNCSQERGRGVSWRDIMGVLGVLGGNEFAGVCVRVCRRHSVCESQMNLQLDAYPLFEPMYTAPENVGKKEQCRLTWNRVVYLLNNVVPYYMNDTFTLFRSR